MLSAGSLVLPQVTSELGPPRVGAEWLIEGTHFPSCEGMWWPKQVGLLKRLQPRVISWSRLSLFFLSRGNGAVVLQICGSLRTWGQGDMADVQKSRLLFQSPACLGKTQAIRSCDLGSLGTMRHVGSHGCVPLVTASSPGKVSGRDPSERQNWTEATCRGRVGPV